MDLGKLNMVRQSRLWFAFLLLIVCSLFSTLFGDAATLPGECSPDRYVEDRLVFIGNHGDQPVLLVLTFSRGTAQRDSQIYATECTGHLFRRERWTHLGPGSYAAPETALALIPSGPDFTTRQGDDSPILIADFENQRRPMRLTVNSRQYFYCDTADTEYQSRYGAGSGTLGLDADTIAGTILSRHIDFTGYNRLAGNTNGYFPGKYEQAVLAAAGGALFVLSVDPVANRDTGNRVNFNFAAVYLADGGSEIITDSLTTRWAAVDDTLYPGKPIPSRW